jgi:hypothetical protein
LCREHLDTCKSTPVDGGSSSSGSDEKEEEEERVALNEVSEGGSTKGRIVVGLAMSSFMIFAGDYGEIFFFANL